MVADPEDLEFLSRANSSIDASLSQTGRSKAIAEGTQPHSIALQGVTPPKDDDDVGNHARRSIYLRVPSPSPLARSAASRLFPVISAIDKADVPMSLRHPLQW